MWLDARNLYGGEAAPARECPLGGVIGNDLEARLGHIAGQLLARLETLRSVTLDQHDEPLR
jgi:hypothetical protein